MDFTDFPYENSEVVYWVWLSLACGAGSTAADMLLTHFGPNAKRIYDADAEAYLQAGEIKQNVLNELLNKDLRLSERMVDWCNCNNVGLLPYDSRYFPDRLRRIQRRPVLLYYLGRIPEINRRLCISMVGTRKIDNVGSKNAYTIAYDLASAGAVVVSGMALGADGVAHRGALDAGGYTIAVLGCGIDRIYPRQHDRLMKEIAMRGTVLTEYCPGTAPVGSNFPIRNRIISGLSQATVVIEADMKSGALITARDALAQGRALFALPGDVGELRSTGTNRLIIEGARPATDALDILEPYSETYSGVLNVENIMNKLSKYRTSYASQRGGSAQRYGSSGRRGNGRSASAKEDLGTSPGGYEEVYTNTYAYSAPEPYRVPASDAAPKDGPEPDGPALTGAEPPANKRGKKRASAATAPEIKPDASADDGYGTELSPEDLAFLSEDARKLFLRMPESGAVTIDRLVREGYRVSELLMLFSELELSDLVVHGHGDEYERRKRRS